MTLSEEGVATVGARFWGRALFLAEQIKELGSWFSMSYSLHFSITCEVVIHFRFIARVRSDHDNNGRVESIVSQMGLFWHLLFILLLLILEQVSACLWLLCLLLSSRRHKMHPVHLSTAKNQKTLTEHWHVAISCSNLCCCLPLLTTKAHLLWSCGHPSQWGRRMSLPAPWRIKDTKVFDGHTPSPLRNIQAENQHWSVVFGGGLFLRSEERR